MSTSVFNNYIADKYQSVDPTTIIVDYQKIVTTTDNGTNTTTVETVSIDENTYNSLATSTLTYSLPTGSVTVAISKKSVSQYDIEVSLNESNRTINILNNNYVDEIEKSKQDEIVLKLEENLINVKKIAFGNWVDRMIYAFGAANGSVVGFLAAK